MKQANRLLHWFAVIFMVAALAVAQEAAEETPTQETPKEETTQEAPAGEAATPAATPQLAVAEYPMLGQFLTDGEGRSLYLNLEDAGDGAACTESCLRYWPAFTASEVPQAAEGIDASLLAAAADAEGEAQISYNGWPLYYFAYDLMPGETRGAGIADVWHLVSPAGEPLGLTSVAGAEETVEADEPGTVVPPVKARSDQEEAELLANYMAEGEQIFANNCAVCHGPAGEGGVGIRLISNPLLADAQDIADAVVHGRGYMPPFGGILDNAQIAAVLTFVRNSWENDFGILEEEVVQGVRR
jgi:mono/diheme cytochrome c family protein